MTSESLFHEFETVIGLECHIQLMTKSKLFSPAKNAFGDPPNTNADVIDLGLPGVLPVINQDAVNFAVRLGFALGCQIHSKSVFSRKHYFYPDLPKGYQISQYDEPICGPGRLRFWLDGKEREIGITRIHIEEDAGKSLHVEGQNASFLDFNRAGTPLLEVVTEPDLRTAEEAMAAFRQLRTIAMYLGICDGNLQEGSLRADLNVSVRRKNASQFGTRTETKNLNSPRFLGQAVEFEARRQMLAVLHGEAIVQQTRLWDPNKKESRALRSKEDAHDYRYFPDPDLLPLVLSENEIQKIRETVPELPDQKFKRFRESLGLNEYDARILTEEKGIADYFERALELHPNAKSIANWIINDVLRVNKLRSDEEEASLASSPIGPEYLAELVQLIDNQTISSKIAKIVFEEMLSSSLSPSQIVQDKGLQVQKDSAALAELIDAVLHENPEEVQKYRAGKQQVFGFLMGKVMQKSQGKAEPQEANEILRQKLQAG